MKPLCKRTLSCLLALALLAGLCLTAFAAPTGFADVAEDAWYAPYVQQTAALDLFGGMGDGTFDPEGALTTAQALKLAACMRQLYLDGSVTLENGSDAWYSTYVDYCAQTGIVSASYALAQTEVTLNAPATRIGYAVIFAQALPEEALSNLHGAPSFPDLPDNVVGYDAVAKLYAAGIVQGDGAGLFHPDDSIRRCEVAAVVARMMDPAQRIGYIQTPDVAQALAPEDYDEVLVLVHTNDVHGFVEGEPYVKAVADGYKALYGDQNVLTLSAGDVFSGGHAFAGMFAGELIPAVMDAAGYDILVPGNNDYDYGVPGLLALTDTFTHTHTICANLYELDSDVSVYDRSAEFETAGGVKVGVFGITVPGGPLEGKYTTPGSVATGRDMTYQLSQDCDVVICVGHTGWNDDLVTGYSNDATSAKVANACEGLDVFIDAHSHSVINQGAGWYSPETGALVTQAGSKSADIGVVFVYLKDGAPVACIPSLLPLAAAKAQYAPDAAAQALVDAGNQKLQEAAGASAGSTDYYLHGGKISENADGRGARTEETNLGDLICDALRDHLGVDVALFPGYLIRSSIQPGEITAVDWTSVFGKGGSVYKFERTGAELEALLVSSISPICDNPKNETPQFYQVSGVTFTYAGKAVSNVLVNGQPLEPDRIYTIAYDGADDRAFDREANVDKLVVDGAPQLTEIMTAFLASGKAEILPDVPQPGGRIVPAG